jgi:hypothetical protein
MCHGDKKKILKKYTMFKNKMHGMYFWNKSHNQVLPVVTLCSSSDRIDRKEAPALATSQIRERERFYIVKIVILSLSLSPPTSSQFWISARF